MFTHFLKLTFPDLNCGGGGGGGGDTGGSYLYWQLGWKLFGLASLWLPLLLCGTWFSNWTWVVPVCVFHWNSGLHIYTWRSSEAFGFLRLTSLLHFTHINVWHMVWWEEIFWWSGLYGKFGFSPNPYWLLCLLLLSKDFLLLSRTMSLQHPWLFSWWAFHWISFLCGTSGCRMFCQNYMTCNVICLYSGRIQIVVVIKVIFLKIMFFLGPNAHVAIGCIWNHRYRFIL